MTQEDIIKTIQCLTELIKVSQGYGGSFEVAKKANEKILELIPLIKI